MPRLWMTTRSGTVPSGAGVRPSNSVSSSRVCTAVSWSMDTTCASRSVYPGSAAISSASLIPPGVAAAGVGAAASPPPGGAPPVDAVCIHNCSPAAPPASPRSMPWGLYPAARSISVYGQSAATGAAMMSAMYAAPSRPAHSSSSSPPSARTTVLPVPLASTRAASRADACASGAHRCTASVVSGAAVTSRCSHRYTPRGSPVAAVAASRASTCDRSDGAHSVRGAAAATPPGISSAASDRGTRPRPYAFDCSTAVSDGSAAGGGGASVPVAVASAPSAPAAGAAFTCGRATTLAMEVRSTGILTNAGRPEAACRSCSVAKAAAVASPTVNRSAATANTGDDRRWCATTARAISALAAAVSPAPAPRRRRNSAVGAKLPSRASHAARSRASTASARRVAATASASAAALPPAAASAAVARTTAYSRRCSAVSAATMAARARRVRHARNRDWITAAACVRSAATRAASAEVTAVASSRQ